MKNKNYFKINFIYFVAIILVAIVFVLGYLGVLQNDILTSFLIQIVVMFAIPLLMYSLLMKKNLKESLQDCGLKKISSKMIIISILLGFVLYAFNSYIASIFQGVISLFGYETLSSPQTTSLNYSTLLKELILSCILPGFCEEFLHRGIMLHANKKHTNTKFCLIVSSILFGLTHLNIRQFFYASILGFLMGYVSLVSNSIIPSVIIHFMNNFLSNYFFYGSNLNWPLAKFLNFVLNFFSQNILIFSLSSIFSVLILILLFKWLTKELLKERAKFQSKTLLKELQANKISLIEAQIQLNHINMILKSKQAPEQLKHKPNFIDNIFLISSLVLGVLITISSFIWGVI